MKSLRFAALLLALAAPIIPAQAGQSVSLILNWTPAADHSPFYYAKSQGWYERAGIDLSIEVGKGSGVSSLKVGSGGAPFGISDLGSLMTVLNHTASSLELQRRDIEELNQKLRRGQELEALEKQRLDVAVVLHQIELVA